MIHVFIGDDTHAKSVARETLMTNFQDREVFFLNEENFTLEQFQNYLSGGDLFAKNYVVVLDSIITSDLGELVLDRAESMATSDTTFVIVETGLLKSPSETLKQHAKSFKIFDLPKGRDEKFNIFSITDAFGSRDKKNTWVLMQKALHEGISAEEILNILIWQTKNLLFVKTNDDMKSTGLSPFVYNKSKSYAKNYELSELENISRHFVSMFHESHLGLELEPHLERYLLKTL